MQRRPGVGRPEDGSKDHESEYYTCDNMKIEARSAEQKTSIAADWSLRSGQERPGGSQSAVSGVRRG